MMRSIADRRRNFQTSLNSDFCHFVHGSTVTQDIFSQGDSGIQNRTGEYVLVSVYEEDKACENRKSKAVFCGGIHGWIYRGILFANLTVRDYVTTSGIYNPYFLKQYAQSDIQAGEYILYLCGIRLIPLALIALLGQTRVRRILSIVVFAWAGFSAGTIVCAGILNMGIQGIVFWVIAMVPQFLFYAFAYLIVLWYFFTVPQSRWNLGKTLFVLLFMAAGLITEAYVNPILMQMFLDTL